MEKILDAWDDYIRVDSSPIFVFPADLKSTLRYSRMELHQKDNNNSIVNISFESFLLDISIPRFIAQNEFFQLLQLSTLIDYRPVVLVLQSTHISVPLFLLTAVL